MNGVKRHTLILITISLGLVWTAAGLRGQGVGGVAAWGGNDYGQTNIPPNLTNVISVVAGGYHNLAVSASGLVTAWGASNNGQTSVPPDLTDAKAVAGGLYHSLCLRSNGTVLSWGNWSSGVTNVPLATDFSAIASGWYHNLALRSNGTVMAWGAPWPYHYGQTIIPEGLPQVMAVAAGGYHSLALLSNGTVVGWGANASGQTNVPIGLTNVVAIAAGGSNSIALKSDGTVVAWGYTIPGQTNILSGLSNIVAIAAGSAHVLALKSDGTAVAWGVNQRGQTNIPAGLTNIAAISAGPTHSLAMVNKGPVTFLGVPMHQTVYRDSEVTLSAACLGAAPVTYQWLHNATNVPGGTNALLRFAHAQASHGGYYQLVASNAFGAATSAPVRLIVNDPELFFASEPANRDVAQSASTTFAAAVGGVPPILYQWHFNGIPITGATTTTLAVPNAQLPNEGLYWLVASNQYGTAGSSKAFLDVIDPAQALGATNLVWCNPSEPGWFVQTSNTLDGFACAAGPFTNQQQGVLYTTVTGPGVLSFWWQRSSYGDFLIFAIDGKQRKTYGVPS